MRKFPVTALISFLVFGCTTPSHSSPTVSENLSPSERTPNEIIDSVQQRKIKPSYEGTPNEVTDAMRQHQPFYFAAFTKARVLSEIKKLPTKHPEVLQRIVKQEKSLIHLVDTCEGKLNPTYATFYDPYLVDKGEYLVLFSCTAAMRTESFRILRYTETNGLDFAPLKVETLEQDGTGERYRKVSTTEIWAFRPIFDEARKELTFTTDGGTCPGSRVIRRCGTRMKYRYENNQVVLQEAFYVRLATTEQSEETTQLYP